MHSRTTFILTALWVLCGSVCAQGLVGERLTFSRAYPSLSTPYWNPSSMTTTVTTGSADLITWTWVPGVSGTTFIDPEASSISWSGSTSEYIGSRSQFDGFVVSGFSRDIDSVSVQSSGGFNIDLVPSARSFTVNLSGKGSGFTLAVRLVPELREGAERDRRESSEALGQLAQSLADIAARKRGVPSAAQQSTSPSMVPQQPTSGSAATTKQASGTHDIAGEASSCIRPNPGASYGGFTNTCAFPVSYIHCYAGVAKDSGDSYAFHCDRPGGLWTTHTTAGNLGPGRTSNTSIPKGAQIFWIACRSPFAIRGAVFDGQAIRASCVRQ